MSHNLYSPFSEEKYELLKVRVSKTVREGKGGNIENVTDAVK